MHVKIGQENWDEGSILKKAKKKKSFITHNTKYGAKMFIDT